MANSKKELLLAILSMDSYNRGYGASIKLPDTKGTAFSSVQIGRRIQDISETFEKEAQAAGFYAVAYEVKAGAWEGLEKDTTVISYRGSDDFAAQYA